MSSSQQPTPLPVSAGTKMIKPSWEEYKQASIRKTQGKTEQQFMHVPIPNIPLVEGIEAPITTSTRLQLNVRNQYGHELVIMTNLRKKRIYIKKPGRTMKHKTFTAAVLTPNFICNLNCCMYSDFYTGPPGSTVCLRVMVMGLYPVKIVTYQIGSNRIKSNYSDQ